LFSLGYLAVQLLQKLSINAVGKREKLLRVIKNPVSRYLPVNSRKIGEVMLYEFSFDITPY
jgi:rRNA small subunit pseudouridine methyltransferase Nep1